MGTATCTGNGCDLTKGGSGFVTFPSCSFPLRKVLPSITFLQTSKPFSTGMTGTGEGSEGGSGVASKGMGDINSGVLGDRGLEGGREKNMQLKLERDEK